MGKHETYIYPTFIEYTNNFMISNILTLLFPIQNRSLVTFLPIYVHQFFVNNVDE